MGILLVLQMSFQSWRLAILNFLTLPSALVGGVLATLFAGGVISLGSLVGFLTVLGIAARNGIMMINHFQHLERHEGEPFGMQLVLRGASERLRPIVMTAATAGLAILPLVIYGDLPGHEIEFPMAVVILGGLVTSTLLSLFILPALYLRFGRGTASLEEVEAGDEALLHDREEADAMTDRNGHTPRIHLAVGRALALAVPVLLVGGVAAAEAQFEKALVYLERNVADDDVEVRFVATAERRRLCRAARDRPGRAHGDRFQVAQLQARHPPSRSRNRPSRATTEASRPISRRASIASKAPWLAARRCGRRQR